MANFYSDNADLRYYIEKGIDWEPLVALTEYNYRAEDAPESCAEAVDFYKDVLELIGDFVVREIAPHSAEIDREGVLFQDGEAVFPARLQQICDALNDLEIHGMCLPRELGGQNCPLLVYMLSAEVIARGDVSVMTHHGFHNGIAMALLVYSINEGSTEIDRANFRITHTRFREAIDEIASGQAWGCMDITEPDAGSDMAALRCVGVQDEQGNWRVSGSKIFVTSGHGKYHLVIARTEKVQDGDDPFAGLQGLSMFLVPTYQVDADGVRRRIVPIDRVEEKLGHHSSATCNLSFDNAPAQLIGKRGEGFKYMLTLMNNARIGVGFESLGLCENAWQLARDYAAVRHSMGKSIDKHEMIADFLDEMESDIQGIRALAVSAAWHEEMSQKLGLQLRFDLLDGEDRETVERRKKRFSRRSRRFTPLLKYLAAEKAVQMAQRCVQIHGGVGYTTEYGAEKLLRDAMVFPIYEGTSQIQALMVMKDTLMGVMKKPRAFVSRMAAARWKALSARDSLERRVARIQVLVVGVLQHLMTRTATDKFKTLQGEPISAWPQRFLKDWDPKRDFAYAMLHAARLTELLADEAVCELLLEQARRHPERRAVLERYLERAEPRCRYLVDQITSTGQGLLERLAAGKSEAAVERPTLAGATA